MVKVSTSPFGRVLARLSWEFMAFSLSRYQFSVYSHWRLPRNLRPVLCAVLLLWPLRLETVGEDGHAAYAKQCTRT